MPFTEKEGKADCLNHLKGEFTFGLHVFRLVRLGGPLNSQLPYSTCVR